MKKIFGFFIALIISLNLFVDANAQNSSSKEMVKKFVQIIGDQIINIANNKKLKEAQKTQQIIDLIDRSIDAKWISRFVLGRHYKNASDEQKKIFMETYREFMINTYGPKFSNYNGKKFIINSVEKQGSFYLAKSEFTLRKSNQVIFFDFRIIEDEGNYFIVDFIAEGVSLLETQRSEFNSIINNEGLDNFLKNLEERVKNLKNNDDKEDRKIVKQKSPKS